MFGKVNKKLEYGIIKAPVKSNRPEKLVYLREELKKLLLKFEPTHVVIEDIYLGLNPKTLVLLAKFAGVVEECCLSISGIESYIIHTSTVKAYFKIKKKKDIFNMIVDILDWEEDTSFNKYNDITDAVAQLFCYFDNVLEYRKFRQEKEYGYLYEV